MKMMLRIIQDQTLHKPLLTALGTHKDKAKPSISQKAHRSPVTGPALYGYYVVNLYHKNLFIFSNVYIQIYTHTCVNNTIHLETSEPFSFTPIIILFTSLLYFYHEKIYTQIF